MSGPTAADVEQLLQQILVPNTQTTNNASEHLMQYLKNPASVPVMFQIMQGSQNPQVRQGAALLLRRKIAKHWNKVPSQMKEAMKSGLLELVVGESERVVRYSVASMVSTVARLTIPSNQWPNLMDYIAQIAQSDSADHREMAYVCLFEIEEHIGDVLERYYPQFYDLFKRGMSPQESPRVQTAAMKCIGMILDWCKEDEQAHARFRELIPMIVDIINQSIHQNRIDDAVTGFSTLQEFIETPFSVIEPYFEALMKFVLEIGANANLDFNVRYEALTVVQWVSSFKAGLILRHNMLSSILTVAFDMCSEEDDDFEDDDSLTAHKYGSQVIDSIARHVQTVSVYPVLRDYVVKYMNSQNPFHRRAALAALIGMSEGCCELMAPQEQLSEWVKIVVAGMKDPHPLVRQVACLALSQFSEWLSPEIYEYFDDLMPLMHNALHEDNAEMQQKACCAIIAFIENIETQNTLPFVDQLMTRLVSLLQQSPNKQVQEMCICAISAIASSTGKGFMTYWAATTQLMAQCMEIVNPEMIVLRSRALECAGLIALAVGKEVFAPHVNYFMQKAIEGYHMDSTGGDLREYTMTFLGNLAECLGQDFNAFLAVAMECIQQSIMSTDGIVEDLSLPAALQSLGEEEYEEPEDEQGEDGEVIDEGGLDDLKYSVQRSYVDEKLQALHSMGVVALAVGPAFLPYIDKAMPLLSFALNYVHHDVRKASAFPIENIMICIHKAFPPQREFIVGSNPEEFALAPETQNFIDMVMPEIINKIQGDIDPETVSRWLDTVKTMMESIGLPSVHKHMSTITSVVANILQGKHECLEEEFEGENENASVETEHLELFCSCTDIIVTMGKQYGNYFSAWLDLLDYIMHFAADKRDGWRFESVGCLAEVTAASHAVISPKVPGLMEVASNRINDEHLPTRSNAAYLLGLLCETGQVTQYFGNIIGTLVALLDKETDSQMVDNVCGCISRMIFVGPNAFDISAILQPLFAKLPLRYDMEEWPPVLKAIFVLFSMQHPAVAPQIPQVIAVLTYLLTQTTPWEKIPAELKEQTVSLVKHLGQSYSEQLQPIVSQLPEEQQAMYSKCVNS